MHNFKRNVSRVCSIISVICLAYNVAYNYFYKGISIEQSFSLDPIGYITTLLPLIISIMTGIYDLIQEGFHGPRAIRWILEPVVYIATAIIEILIILYFKMNIGFSIEPNSQFLLGVVIILSIAFIQALIFAFLENESIVEVFTGRTVWLAWFLLAAMNGANEAKFQISHYSNISPDQLPVAWLVITLICTLAFAVWLVLYTIIAFVRGVFTGFKE